MECGQKLKLLTKWGGASLNINHVFQVFFIAYKLIEIVMKLAIN